MWPAVRKFFSTRFLILFLPAILIVGGALLPLLFGKGSSKKANERYLRQADDLSALWSFYKHTFIRDGRVVSLDEGGNTTSEGQGYALLRAVWSNDRETFDSVWAWTRRNLQVRGDRLFAWKWNGTVVDSNAATDADTDIALALILAERKFGESFYREEALSILDDIWKKEVLRVGKNYVVTAGNWAVHERFPTIHVAYLAPYAYEEFAGVDSRHPWKHVVAGSYEILHWLYGEKKVSLPPEVIYIDRNSGGFLLRHPQTGKEPAFSYDAFPLFWRMALDKEWSHRREGDLRARMISFFEREWKAERKFYDRYTIDGRPLSDLEALPLYATVHALAGEEGSFLADDIRAQKLDPLWQGALEGQSTPYYLHNWLWFSRALELEAVRDFDEFLGFLRPFDFVNFSSHFPWILSLAALVLYSLARFHRYFRIAFFACGVLLCIRYLLWRALYSLNFVEPLGPLISLTLWSAEIYCFSTVLLLAIQVGFNRFRRMPKSSAGYDPTVDIFIPIYTEPAEILEVTLAAALAVDYPKKRVYVLDDGHRPEVKRLTEELGAAYILGPKIHAKAGNLNNALSKSSGDLVVVFDTDHIPVRTFLKETVPPFEDSKVGCVQTPHHFRNADIFQRAYRLNRRLSNEQDMFNHAIQSGRDSWGGAFFVGSGAVFRRKAVEQLGGFLLMSITEDIHTSQHLHARGWRSVFVDKDLAVGLAAENLVSYLVQRRRWMLGCLQIFFKDNPLLSRTLPWRHRLGYFASLYYFFFPLARMVFWLTPLYFLLFHLHPIISDVSLLLAYLLPFMIFLPMLSSSLLPGWPRTGWGVLYETMVAAPLFRSMFDLLLPRSLAFKVTPKGVVAEKRRFDSASALLTSGMAILTLAAIAKGFAEFYYFGIEKDAYFFNLGWAIYNLVFLAAALQVAWERPQLRTEERVRRSFPAVLSCEGKDLPVRIENMSISGCSMILAAPSVIPARPTLQFRLSKESFELPGKLIYNERVARRKWSVGVAFEALFTNDRRRFALALLAAPESWDHVHEGHIRRRFWMGLLFATSLARYFSPLRYRRRQFPRERGIRFFRFVDGGVGRTVVQRELSGRGFSFLTSRPLPLAKPCPILEGSDPEKWARPLYCVRRFPGIWRVGMEFCPQPAEEMPWQSYLAA